MKERRKEGKKEGRKEGKMGRNEIRKGAKDGLVDFFNYFPLRIERSDQPILTTANNFNIQQTSLMMFYYEWKF